MRKKILKYISLVMVLTLVIGIFAACDKTEGDADKTEEPTVSPTENPTSAPPTAEPTPEATKAPKATIKPGTGEYAEGIKSEDAVWANIFSDTATGEPTIVASTMAVQFFATTTFDQVRVTFVTYSAPKDPQYSIKYYLYAWQGTYDDTLLSEPIKEEEKVNFNDWENVVLEFDAQPDGEYLLLIDNENAHTFIGVYNRTEEYEGQVAYKDDQLWENKSLPLQIHYTKTPTKLYGPLSDPW